MDELKKKYKEIIALYKLENELTDIFVEGNSDKVFIDNFLKSKRCNKKILLIETVDFSEIQTKDCIGLNIHSNRDKILILSNLVSHLTPSSKVKFLVDKDFDDYTHSITNKRLLKTDYSCIEAYLLSQEIIDKFLVMGISHFPFEASFVITQLSKVLKHLFCFRLLRLLKLPSAQLLDLEKNLAINKTTGEIQFDEKDYLNKFILKNNLAKDKAAISSEYDQLFKKLSSESRDNLNGHDFLQIFFLYVNKIKNTVNYRQENFSKSLFLAVEPKMIEGYKLFKQILK